MAALRYLLDTDICIYITKEKPKEVKDRFSQLSIGEVAMSAITYGELLYGAEKSKHRSNVLEHLNQLANYIPPLPLSIDVAENYGKIRAFLAKKGQPIGNNDLWIAATALSLDIILVTNNEKEFRRVKELKIENWS